MQTPATMSVGPTAEYLVSGMATVSARRHLNPEQFPVKKSTPSIDNGWGPLGSYGKQSPSGSLYGYGVRADNPQY